MNTMGLGLYTASKNDREQVQHRGDFWTLLRDLAGGFVSKLLLWS